MKFRPCIDIHNGKVKQIVGGSLKDEGNAAKENFQSASDADYFANLYRKDGLTGGHVILLNPASSEYYPETKRQALLALRSYPKGLQVGGGMNPENAQEFLDAGASHVVITSYAFREGRIIWENLEAMKKAVGKEHVVIDLSCRKKDGAYFVVTDRWQKFTEMEVTQDAFESLADYCDEFLVHGVDVEGKACGVDESLARILEAYQGNPVTYAGGIGSMADLKKFESLTKGKVDFTIGSALDLFGGALKYKDIAKLYG